MPRRKSLTRRFLQHLPGRRYDDWDEAKLVEPALERSHKSRFAQTLSFGAVFFAGLALSAGAGNGVRALFEDGSATPAAAQGASGATGASGPTGATSVASPRTAFATQSARTAVAREQAARPVTASAPAARTAVASSAPTRSALRPVVAPTATKERTAVARTRTARPARAYARPHRKAPARHREVPKAPPPPLDPEVHSFSASTVWLNRAAPDPTPPAARLKLQFARDLVRYSRKAHVDWALVLATLRAEGNNGRAPAGKQALRSLSYHLASLRKGQSTWAAALAYSSNPTVADRVVALRHYYRAVGLASLVHGLLSQKRDLQDRLLHDSRVVMYSGGRADVAAGRVDVRVLATILYLADTFHQVTVSCLVSGHRLYARPGVVSAHIYGRAVDIAALNNVSITGHQQPGGLTEQAVRGLLMLPGGMLPKQVISLLGLGGPSFPLANHYDHIHVGF
jgi:hypothetical protein